MYGLDSTYKTPLGPGPGPGPGPDSCLVPALDPDLCRSCWRDCVAPMRPPGGDTKGGM